MRDETFTGLWWLPDSESTRLSGTLETSVSNPPVLTLIGSFAPFERIADRNDYPVIHGFSDKGRRITLLHGTMSNMTFNAPGIQMEEIRASAALIGAHFSSPDEVIATQTWADFTYLAEWLGPGAFADEFSEDDRFLIRYRRPDFPEWRIGDAVVQVRSSWKTKGDAIRGRAIEAGYSVAFTVEDRLDSVIDTWVQPMLRFLTLAVDVPNVLTSIQFKSTRGVTNQDNQLVTAIFPVALPTRRLPRRPPTVHDMLFSYPHVVGSIEALLRGWYKTHNALEPICDLYFTTRERGGPIEVQFLNLVRALGVYDRFANGNTVRPKDEHRAMVQQILGAAPNEHRDWLRDKLAWSNEPTLRTRLARLWESVQPVAEPIAPDRDAFAAVVADTRNYLTHYDPTLANKAATGEALFRTNQRMEVLLAALLLVPTEIDRTLLHDLFANNQSYIFLRGVTAGVES